MVPGKSSYLLLIAVLLFATNAFSQTAQNPTAPVAPQAETPRRGPHQGFRPRRMRLRENSVRSLNLTEAQQQQQKAIRQRYFVSTRTQRQQLFDIREKELAGTLTNEDREQARALRQEMRTSTQNMRNEMLSTLTPEQRSQAQAFQEQRKQRREERMKRRQELPQTRPIN